MIKIRKLLDGHKLDIAVSLIIVLVIIFKLFGGESVKLDLDNWNCTESYQEVRNDGFEDHTYTICTEYKRIKI